MEPFGIENPLPNLGFFGKNNMASGIFAFPKGKEKDLKIQRVPSEILIKHFELLMVCRDLRQRGGCGPGVKLNIPRDLIRCVPSRIRRAREYSPAPMMKPGRKIEAGRAKETTLKNYYEDTRCLIGINIEPAQSDYHAPPMGDDK